MQSLFVAPSGVSSPPPNRRAGRRSVRLVMLLVVAFVIGNAVGSVRGLTAVRQASEAFETLSEAVARLRQENGGLRVKARQLREDSNVIEDLARQELGLIRPGEKVFILSDQPPGDTAPAPAGP
ncbi:MAG: septum formation initiator family protein [Acidobacteria bacterium]|nr:septum formation initiator family protein [Acidobacteriota bacterium]